jgi:signal transduction histidine kinase
LDEARRSQDEVSALLRASRAVLRYQDFEGAARAIFESCRDLIGARLGYVAILSEDGKENEVLFLESGGLPCTVDQNRPMPIKGLGAVAYEKGGAVYENDFLSSEWKELLPEGHVDLENVMFAPLMMEGKPIGLIGLANKPGGFTDHDAELTAAFGEFAAMALHNSRMWEALERSEEANRLAADLERQVQEQEARLTEKEFFEEIGRISSELAHDLRSPLQTISNSVYLLEEDPQNREYHNNIYDAVRYASSLLDSFREYYRGHEITPTTTDLHAIIEQAIGDVQVPDDVEVEKRFDSGIGDIQADPMKMRRAFNNLIKNAVEAMPEGGSLTITTESTNEAIVISIADTGVGILEDIIDLIFKPFGSKKQGGMGLGLASAYRVVRAHRGEIGVESSVGEGTTFTIRLPRS